MTRSRSSGAADLRGVSVWRHSVPSVAISASAITFSGRPETWLALRRRANASSSVKPFLLHQQALRALDRLARGERLGERLGLLAHRRELLVAGAGGRDRGHEVLLAERLHEVAEDARLDRAGDELLLAVGGQHHDRDRPLVEDPLRRLDPVELRHLHVHDRELRLVLAGERDRLLAVARLGDDLVAGALEQVAQVEPDDRLVFGDQDAHSA